MRTLRLFALPLSLVVAACTAGPITGQIVTTEPAGLKFTFTGASDTKLTPVTAFVLTNPDANPIGGSYTLLGSTTTSATGTPGNDSKPYFSWIITANQMPGTAWPSGGLVRMKARSKFNGSTTLDDMFTFDSYQQDMTQTSCLSSELNAGVAWRTAGSDCASPYELSRIITVVSSVTTPSDSSADTLNYLSVRGNASPSIGQSIPGASDTALATANYYANIGAPPLFSGPVGGAQTFIHKYGFDAGPGDEAHAIYYNAGDLGIARDMHCRSYWPTGYPITSPPGKACYVSNYGRINNAAKQFPVSFGTLPTQQVIDQAIAGSAVGPQTGVLTVTTSTPAATVAMIYDPTSAANSVQFMVYDNEGALTGLAALDNGGVDAIKQAHLGNLTNSNVIVPLNCLTCHGASSHHNPSLSGVSSITGATFLPFDPDSFEFSTTNSSYFKTPMLAPIKALNAHVYASAPKPAVTTLLNGMYGNAAGGPTNGTAQFTPTYVPASWTSGGESAVQVYNEVVKPYCRSCHSSHDTAGGLDWGNWNDFHLESTSIGAFVCNQNSTVPMPQAEQTQTRMWKSPARAHLVNALSIGGACAPCATSFGAACPVF